MEDLTNSNATEQRDGANTPPGGVDGSPASAAIPSTDPGEAGALSVTRPMEISVVCCEPRVAECRVLLAGIDTLDFGMYVEFDVSWSRIVVKLAQLKRAARGTKGRPVGDGRCLILPSGKPNYPFHLQYPGFQLYLSRKSRPDGETSNVFVSLNSQLLWDTGERAAVGLVLSELAELARGTVRECRMSRCDLSVDLLLPGGLTDDFVRQHAVSHTKQYRIFADHDRLQTLYVGGTNSDIRLRLYDKSVEIAHSEKLWFLPLWGLAENADVWRFEFQVRRSVLKACGINSLGDLRTRSADLWRYLTDNWFSLRLRDDENATRRTVHPLWQTLQECANRFGPLTEPLKRLRPQPSLDASRSVHQAASSLVGFAARKGLTTLEAALPEFVEELRREFQSRNFEDDRQRKAIQLGLPAHHASSVVREVA